MRKILLLLLLLEPLSNAYSQNNPTAYFIDQLNMVSTSSRIDTNAYGEVITVSEFKQNNVKLNAGMEMERYFLGTPFFMNGWYKGKVALEGSEPVSGLMAYDLNKNKLYYSKNQNSQAVELQPNDFTINGVQFSKFEGEYSGAGNYYYETLIMENPMLLKQYDCNYTQTKTQADHGYGSGSSSKYEGEFVQTVKYYFALDKRMNLVKNKKSFFRSMGEYSEDSFAYSKKEKLNLKKEEDIIKLGRYLAGLEK